MALFEKKTIIKNEIDYEKLADIIIKTKQVDIDYDKFASSFIDAIEKNKKEAQNSENKKREIQRETTLHDLGVGKGDLTNNKFKDFIKQFFAVLKMKREHLGYHDVIADLKKTLSQIFFQILEIALILFGYIIILRSAFYASIIYRISYSFLGFTFVFFSNVFRIASYEVELMEDESKINETFISVLTFINVIAAIAAAVFAFKGL
ncbi:hypothetical protein [Ruminococcus sp.]|uniref:hypothetical protein n=1 Tax=Ruminococcus sp. TaxID=41978 RepID=UPI00258F6461|nr:hypothetical protein [Ruminococcus sp.]MCR5020841.1 hypothetical protein [Ruminococcus sp.]